MAHIYILILKFGKINIYADQIKMLSLIPFIHSFVILFSLIK